MSAPLTTGSPTGASTSSSGLRLRVRSPCLTAARGRRWPVRRRARAARDRRRRGGRPAVPRERHRRSDLVRPGVVPRGGHAPDEPSHGSPTPAPSSTVSPTPTATPTRLRPVPRRRPSTATVTARWRASSRERRRRRSSRGSPRATAHPGEHQRLRRRDPHHRVLSDHHWRRRHRESWMPEQCGDLR